ncbi:stress response protein nst1-like isoform X2 [Magnolia sinica]|uniref:stress response protein nst1-like isoform X2 n=1 Tax=Magnolia sinica TaxID=86752 RepID=UPI00265A4811|nr:stress response protein nst1-like isoform X2 [Magnolia sinica]
MCILCVVQKWSRRVATMLPWLVIPLIGLWALSQLLPPGFRFEVTSPRLACVFVLLVTLFWYEVLMPQLSAWRLRRSARLREQRRFEAIEMEKLRKTATRRCRNCLTPYRDQNPGGGRFMCSYCGHISRRPVLDMQGPASLGITSSGIGKIWNSKVWSENGWICGQDWSENGNWGGGSFVGKPGGQWGRNGGAFFSGDDRCVAEKSYSGVVVFACKLLASFFLSIRWLWRKIFRVGSTREDASSDAEHKGLLSKKGENGVNLNESKGEKARRKAEEKRQARLEREMLEEEERKQREEVARLVEERRRLRDEKLEAEKERGKGSTPDRERDNRRETERRRQEKRKEKDKGSNKSNSDGEELERKVNRESERKREFDKRSEIERRDLQKTTMESIRPQSSEIGNGMKNISTNFSRPSGGGSRYFDRMKGSFLSSSKAFNGATFFGRGAHASATAAMKVNRPSGSGDHVQTSTSRREVLSSEHIAGKFTSNGDDKLSEAASQRPVVSDLQPQPIAPKKTWQQLFTRSSAVTSSLDANTMSQPSPNHQTEARSPQLPDQAPPKYHLDNPIQFGLPLPFSPLCTTSISSSVSPPAAGSVFPLVGNPAHDFISEDAELFEDPCYVPDPVSLLGPVSESLDNFPLDLGTGFVSSSGLERSHVLKNVSASTEVSKPSPIESPMSKLRVAEERHFTSSQLPCTPRSRDLHASSDESVNAHEQGTWQMWGTPPLGPASWLLPLGQNKTNQENIVHPSTHKAIVSQFPKENQVLPGASSPQNARVGNDQSGGTFSPLGPGSNEADLWLHKTVLQPLVGDGDKHFPPLNLREDISQNEMTYDGVRKAGAGHPFEQSPGSCWSKDWAVQGQVEGDGNSTLAMPPIGGLFSTPDVQSLWSFN